MPEQSCIVICTCCKNGSVCKIVKDYIRKYRSQTSKDTVSMYCTLCKKKNHNAKRCPYKNNKPKKVTISLNNPYEVLNDVKTVEYQPLKCTKNVDLWEPEGRELWSDRIDEEFNDEVW